MSEHNILLEPQKKVPNFYLYVFICKKLNIL